ncbi:hypothetical protein CLAIMM_09194 [Cladophialophora immunda]|nr:hypothetical protein CLAIMM_09194 [Cladophialophora immunda]
MIRNTNLSSTTTTTTSASTFLTCEIKRLLGFSHTRTNSLNLSRKVDRQIFLYPRLVIVARFQLLDKATEHGPPQWSPLRRQIPTAISAVRGRLSTRCIYGHS